MAMTDAEQAEHDKLKADLSAAQKQLTDLLAKTQTDKNDAAAAEAKRSKDKAGKVELDPDVVKEVAELKKDIAEMKQRLGTGSSGGGFLDFFGSK
jgi:hypothetical protein